MLISSSLGVPYRGCKRLQNSFDDLDSECSTCLKLSGNIHHCLGGSHEVSTPLTGKTFDSHDVLQMNDSRLDNEVSDIIHSK